MLSETAVVYPQSLAQRMSQGRLPVHDALRYALILAEALRKLHETGQVHGAVSPDSISLTRSGLELLPPSGIEGEITAYTAPEVVLGAAPDSRSDIFSFGALVYEMLTGRTAFHAETREALAEAITGTAPPPSGSPAIDRLVASCLAKDPGARLQRVQKLILELKLLAVAVRRAEAARALPESVARQDFDRLETQFAARIASLEQSIAGFEQRLASLEQAVNRLPGDLDALHREAMHLREQVADDLGMLEKTLKAHQASIESTRTAVAQTDDLVERVVEALESLQSVVLEHAGEAALGSD
jgi:methyl-accepting chemotaxis protein